VPAWKCGCARTGQFTATRATRLIPTALGSPRVAANREARSVQDIRAYTATAPTGLTRETNSVNAALVREGGSAGRRPMLVDQKG
jgi:hypothetical protein